MEWISAAQPPDDDLNVLVALADSEVWIGYHTADGWCSSDGADIEPTHWTNLPTAPL